MVFLLVVTDAGYGKRVKVGDIPRTGRNRAGVTIAPVPPAGAVVVTSADDVLIATRAGKIERVAAVAVPVQGRRARGVRVVTLAEGDRVAGVAVAPRDPADNATVQHEGALRKVV
jgi:DNA gyrase subunit A